MPRETKAQLAARVAADNDAAARVPVGAVYHDGIFGVVTLGPVTGDQSPDGWSHYNVQHSGVSHTWSSALVARVDWEV